MTVIENARTCARCGHRTRAASVTGRTERTVGACSVCGYGASERVRRNSPAATAARIRRAGMTQMELGERPDHG